MNSCKVCGTPFKQKRREQVICSVICRQINNGSQERKELGERGVYRRAKAMHRPDEYQILCMNCQFIKRHEDGRSNQHGKRREYVQQHGECLTCGADA